MVLDSSGSMSRIEDDTKGGFNQFLEDQREETGEATLSLYEFSGGVTPVYQGIQVEDAQKLNNDNYTPGGRTALHDAIARAVDETDAYIQGQPRSEHPENVIVVVLTDGKENASETPQETVRSLVEEKRDSGWEFLFIGANQDAALTAEGVGMDADKSLNMSRSGDGVKEAQRATSRSISRARQQGETGGYKHEDRQKQDEV
jgi:Mg-chelatase subunit ChlD